MSIKHGLIVFFPGLRLGTVVVVVVVVVVEVVGTGGGGGTGGRFGP